MSDLLLKTSNYVLDIKTSPCSVFVATNSGLDIINPDNLTNEAFVILESGFNSLVIDQDRCEENHILLGSSVSGVCELVYNTTLTGDLSNDLVVKYSYPELPSNNIISLNRNDYDEVVVGTNSGVSFINISGDIFSCLINCDIVSCNITNSGDCYYAPNNSGVYVKYGPITANWSVEDYYLSSSTTPALLGNIINEILLGDLTDSGSEVYLATDSGIAIYSEDRSSMGDSYFYTLINELNSSTKNVEGIELYPDTTISSGNLLYSTHETGVSGTVAIIDLSSKTEIENYYFVNFESTSGGTAIISGASVLDLEEY